MVGEWEARGRLLGPGRLTLGRPERVRGTGERVATQLFNGYGEFVAELYAGLANERLFM